MTHPSPSQRIDVFGRIHSEPVGTFSELNAIGTHAPHIPNPVEVGICGFQLPISETNEPGKISPLIINKKRGRSAHLRRKGTLLDFGRLEELERGQRGGRDASDADNSPPPTVRSTSDASAVWRERVSIVSVFELPRFMRRERNEYSETPKTRKKMGRGFMQEDGREYLRSEEGRRREEGVGKRRTKAWGRIVEEREWGRTFSGKQHAVSAIYKPVRRFR